MRDNWYHHWVVGATLDDQLWHQALVMDRVLESLCGSEQGPNDAMMWTLLRRGVVDADVVDKPWNGSTRSMRYSAVLVGRLWGLLAGERTRVSLHPSFQQHWIESWSLLREIVWNGVARSDSLYIILYVFSTLKPSSGNTMWPVGNDYPKRK